MKRLIAITTLAAALLLGGTANAVQPIPPADSNEAFCSLVSQTAFSAAEWRDTGVPYRDAVRNFNHGWNSRWTNDSESRQSKRVYDIAIRQAYAPPQLEPETERKVAYNGCLEYLKKTATSSDGTTARDEPDSDLRSDPSTTSAASNNDNSL